AKGVAPSTPSDYTPTLRDNVCYIVAAVLVNDEGHVLMMQEAKSSCAGKWYLPAGRMEAGETIVEAAKREVLEETGLETDITTLLMVESASGSWFRFVVTGTVVGGTLKTPASADKESLQAKWVEDLSELSLRGNDIYPLIRRAKQYWAKEEEPWHPALQPINKPHTRLLLRLEIFGSDLPPHRPQGVMNVELKTSSPSGDHDGMCLTLLVPIRKALEDVPLIDKYSWVEVPKPLGEDLLNRMGKNMTVPLNVIRVSTLIN
ncbi:8-oxo-dGDP phosphatase NUDT18-like, partial [Homarus americanus]